MPVMANEPIILNVYDMVSGDLLVFFFFNVAFNAVRSVAVNKTKTKDSMKIHQLFFHARIIVED